MSEALALSDVQKGQLVDALIRDRLAPTPRELRELDVELSVSCPACRNLRDGRGLVQLLIARGKGDETIDRIMFRCQEHGERGTPIVSVRLYGRDTQRLWPPLDERRS